VTPDRDSDKDRTDDSDPDGAEYAPTEPHDPLPDTLSDPTEPGPSPAVPPPSPIVRGGGLWRSRTDRSDEEAPAAASGQQGAAAPLNLMDGAPAPHLDDDWDRAKSWAAKTSWALRGGAVVAVAAILMLVIPAHGSAQYKSAGGFVTLAGFTFLAAALERIAEFALAPWWGLVATKKVAAALDTAHALEPQRAGAARGLRGSSSGGAARDAEPSATIPSKVGVSGALALRASARSAHVELATTERSLPAALDADEEAISGAHEATTAAKAASDEADSVYAQAVKQRPTIMLPMAALAGLVCYCLHLFLLHSLAHSGVSDTHLAFVVDGVLTGFAIAGGAQPFHDLISGLTSSSAAKKAAAR
jgi:hypothetical protein